jgi:hypothetical protein
VTSISVRICGMGGVTISNSVAKNQKPKNTFMSSWFICVLQQTIFLAKLNRSWILCLLI